MARVPVRKVGGVAIRAGESRDVFLRVSESYTGDPVNIPLRVVRARRAGPCVLAMAATHGDELNGTGIIHELMFESQQPLQKGMLILAPVVNVFGFEAGTRYMPDRRDLNRCFPGKETGSLTSRVAHRYFQSVVCKADYVIDLHTAATGRTNFPNVRANLADKNVRFLARAFGCEMTVRSPGARGTLRREASRAGHPTIILEAGEPGKMEPGILDVGVRGISNVLKELGMLSGAPEPPPYRIRIEKSTWVRAEVGGVLRFHVRPGDAVAEGEAIATNVSLLAREQNVLVSPVDGVVLGMTTLPTVKPGEPVCHIAIPTQSFRRVKRKIADAPTRSLTARVRRELATSISVSEREEEWASPAEEDVE